MLSALVKQWRHFILVATREEGRKSNVIKLFLQSCIIKRNSFLVLILNLVLIHATSTVHYCAGSYCSFQF